MSAPMHLVLAGQEVALCGERDPEPVMHPAFLDLHRDAHRHRGRTLRVCRGCEAPTGGGDVRPIAAAIVTATLCVCSVVADVSTTISERDATTWGVLAGLGLLAFAIFLAGGDK